MQSLNFEFLRPRWEELAELGALAEMHSHVDPSSAAVKLRSFAEQIVLFIYHHHGLPNERQWNLNDLLTGASFQQCVPRVVLSKLHTLRINGNKAAHGESVLTSTAVWLIQEAYELGRWMHLSYAGGAAADCPSFVTPGPSQGSEAERKLRRERSALLTRLAAQEEKMKQLLAELDAARARQSFQQASPPELHAAREQGQRAADTLSFSEETTRRRLIDTQLVAAGWRVDPEGTSSDSVGQEHDVDHQPTATGKGKADYVLWGDNGKPLAVIEAKKTSLDADAGRTQAKCYADGLEAMTGQRPVIFYTNGYDIWIWNDAQSEPPRKLYGIYSQASLEYMIFQRRAAISVQHRTRPQDCGAHLSA